MYTIVQCIYMYVLHMYAWLVQFPYSMRAYLIHIVHKHTAQTHRTNSTYVRTYVRRTRTLCNIHMNMSNDDDANQ